MGFAVPVRCRTRGALLPHRFTLTTHVLRRRSAVCSLLHFPSAFAAQALPGTVPCGARTFLGILSDDATAWPTPRAAFYRFAVNATPKVLPSQNFGPRAAISNSPRLPARPLY